MRLSRRRLVVGGLAAGLAGAAGCVSGGSNVRYPSPTDGKPLVEEGSEATAADRETPDEEVTDPHPALGRRTGRIYGELRWFATEYEAAVTAFRTAARRAVGAVRAVLEAREPTTAAIDSVEAATDDVLAVVEAELDGHFAVRGFLADQFDRHLRTTRTFAGRGDDDRALEELDRLETFLDGLARGQFVDRQLSRDPIRNRLLAALGLEGSGDGRVLFELYDRRSEFRTYAYDGPSSIDRSGPGAFDTEAVARHDTLFGPARSRRRTGVAYVLARQLPPRDRQPDPLTPGSYPGASAMIQRFEDVATAHQAARELLGEGPVTGEGRAALAGRRWRRVFYPVGEDVVYAFMLRGGPHHVVVAPSETAWNERTDWTGGLDRSWLWAND